MRLFLDICQGIGLSASAGVRPFLPTLAAGGLAGADIGVDFDHTPYSFLESSWFLVLILALLGFSVALLRRLGPDALESGPVGAALAGIASGRGALLFAGSLADHGFVAWPGLIGGILVAAFSQLVVRRLFQRVRARLDADAKSALVVYADGTSLLAAVGAILIAPVSLAFVALLALLGRGGRRREGQKYAGLRILR
jgi:hypothetical protein